MYKVHVIVVTDDFETYDNELDGVIYPDKLSAEKAINDAFENDHLDDKFNISRWYLEEV